MDCTTLWMSPGPRRAALAALASAMLTAGACLAQSEESADTLTAAQRMEELFFEWDRLDRPGGAVVVIQDGQVAFQHAYGLASVEHGVANTPRTLFDGVSVAMPITGMAVLMLAEEGALSLDDDVHRHIPGLPAYERTVTLRHLLNHTSGIWDWSTILPVCGRRSGDVITLEDILGLAERQQKLLFDPGSECRFSRTNYNLLAEVVARVTGGSFRDWCWDRLFRPLGMLRTLVRDRYAEPVENQAYAYDYHPRRGYRRGADNLAAVGSDCLFTSVEDMSKWLLNLETGAVGGAAVIEKTLAPGLLETGEEVPRACGWEIDTYKGLTRLKAEGQREGYNAALHYYPQQRCAILLLCNWVSGWIAPIQQAEGVADIYLAAHLETPLPPPAPSASDAAVSVDPAVLAGYEGDYRWRPGFVVGIRLEDDQLMLVTPNGARYELQAQSAEEFALLGRYRLEFVRGEADDILQMVIRSEGEEDLLAPRIELVQPTQDDLLAYTGTYVFPELDVTYDVALQAGALVIRHPGLPAVHLTPEARDHFTADAEDYTMVVFSRDAHQRVSGFSIQGLDLAFQRR